MNVPYRASFKNSYGCSLVDVTHVLLTVCAETNSWDTFEQVRIFLALPFVFQFQRSLFH